MVEVGGHRPPPTCFSRAHPRTTSRARPASGASVGRHHPDSRHAVRHRARPAAGARPRRGGRPRRRRHGVARAGSGAPRRAREHTGADAHQRGDRCADRRDSRRRRRVRLRLESESQERRAARASPGRAGGRASRRPRLAARRRRRAGPPGRRRHHTRGAHGSGAAASRITGGEIDEDAVALGTRHYRERHRRGPGRGSDHAATRHRCRGDARATSLPGPGDGDRRRERRQGPAGPGVRRASHGRPDARGRQHLLPDRLEHQGLHDRPPRPARRFGQARLGRSGHEVPAVVPALGSLGDARVHDPRPRDAPLGTRPGSGGSPLVPLELRRRGGRAPPARRQAVTGRPWSAVVKDRIVTPLGMTAAGTDIALMSSANAAAAHSLLGGPLHVVPLDTIDNTLPAGGIIANVTDLAKWMIARLDSGALPGGGRLFSVRQAAEMWAPQTILPVGNTPPPLAALRANFAAYGLGWSLRDYRGHKIVSHDGGLAGMTSRTLLVPDLQLGIVMLTNAEQPVYGPLGFELLDHFLGAPRTDWITRIHDVVAQAEAGADSMQRAQAAQRDSTSHPSLPLARYAGAYADAIYGDVTIALEGEHLVLRFSHSPAFVGDLGHWQYDTFVAHWRTAHIEDAYVTFSLHADGTIEHFKMAAVSPLADFSFDYQDLLFVPAP